MNGGSTRKSSREGSLQQEGARSRPHPDLHEQCCDSSKGGERLWLSEQVIVLGQEGPWECVAICPPHPQCWLELSLPVWATHALGRNEPSPFINADILNEAENISCAKQWNQSDPQVPLVITSCYGFNHSYYKTRTFQRLLIPQL